MTQEAFDWAPKKKPTRLTLVPLPEDEMATRPRTRAECMPCQICQDYMDDADAEEALVLACGHHVADAPNHCRPCARISCKHNLAVDVTDAGSLRFNVAARSGARPGTISVVATSFDPARAATDVVRWWDSDRPSCALDVADEGWHTTREIGGDLHLTHQAVTLVIERALRKLRCVPGARRLLLHLINGAER
jgi:hypothetical protein